MGKLVMDKICGHLGLFSGAVKLTLIWPNKIGERILMSVSVVWILQAWTSQGTVHSVGESTVPAGESDANRVYLLSLLQSYHNTMRYYSPPDKVCG